MQPTPMPPTPQFSIEEDELSLKDILLKVKEYVRELKRYWYYIPILAIPLAILFLLPVLGTVPEYPGNITFMVTEDKGSDIGSVGSLLGSFGIPGERTSESALEKVLQLSRSRRIVENTLFKKIEIDGKSDFIANHIINIYGWDRILENNKLMGMFALSPAIKNLEANPDIRFTTGNKEKFTKEQGLLLKIIYNIVVGSPKDGIDPMVSNTIDEKTGIMSISLKTPREDLTIEMIVQLYEQLSQYYIDKTVEKQLRIYEIAQFKTDSIQNELALADRLLAEFVDKNRNLVWVRGELEKTKLERKARILEILYGEAIKQLELSDFSLRRQTPYVEIIDYPARPISPQSKSKVSAVLMGIVIGTILAVVFILGRKLIRDALKEEEDEV